MGNLMFITIFVWCISYSEKNNWVPSWIRTSDFWVNVQYEPQWAKSPKKQS